MLEYVYKKLLSFRFTGKHIIQHQLLIRKFTFLDVLSNKICYDFLNKSGLHIVLKNVMS